jgi:F-type H+-transporting ATPase subunit b
MAALRERESSIENALSMAEKAKLEMQALKAGNEKLLAEARAERDRILKDAADASNQMIEAAKGKATEESNRLIAQAREAVSNEKRAAIAEIKSLAGNLSVEIAEQLLKRELSDASAQKQLVSDYMKEVTLN